MQYFDKSSGRTVHLTPSRTEYLVVGRSGDEETLGALLVQNVFAITPSTQDRQVFRLVVNTESESVAEIQRALEQLTQSGAVDAIAPAFKDAQGNLRYALPGRVTIRTRSTLAETEATLRRLGSSVLRRFRTAGLFEIEVPDGQGVAEFIQRLNEEEAILFAEPSFYGFDDAEIRARVNGEAQTSDPGVPGEPILPWNLLRVGARAAWRTTTGAADVVVGVIDGRPDTEHPALAGRFLMPLEAALVFCEGVPPVSHATNVASVVAAAGERAKGLAPGLKLLPLVVDLRAQRYAERADAISFAANAARRRNVEGHEFARLVLCCSWRTAGDIAVIRSAIADAVAAGVLLVFSAGNDGNEQPHFPSDYSRSEPFGEGVISVAATTETDELATFSNHGPNVDLCAPGGDGLPIDERDILCADQDSSYAFAAGTSIAAPHVAACAGLLLSLDATLSPARLKRILKESAQSIDAANPRHGGKLGSGRLNAAAALERASSVGPAPDENTTPAPSAAGPTSRIALVEIDGAGASVSAAQAVRAAREALTLRVSTSRTDASGFRVIQATLQGPGAKVVLFVDP